MEPSFIVVLAVFLASFSAALVSHAPGGLGVPMLAAGIVLLVASMMLTSARSTRTRYRPDPWRWPEWGTVVAGGVVLTVLVVAANVDGAALRPAYSPLTVPSLPLFPVVGVLIAGLPVLLTPPLPQDRP